MADVHGIEIGLGVHRDSDNSDPGRIRLVRMPNDGASARMEIELNHPYRVVEVDGGELYRAVQMLLHSGAPKEETHE